MTVLELEEVTKTFQRGSGPIINAVNGVSLTLAAGETLALIGESGSGKSTLGRVALGLLPASSGTVRVDGVELGGLSPKELRLTRPRMQIVFQEPYQSLNPRRKIGQIVREPLDIHATDMSQSERRARVHETLEQVGLPQTVLNVYPRALSGGMQQRVGIARAIVTRPKLVVLDEPTSSLDLSIRAQILNLLTDLQKQFGLAYLFISHDIATVRHISERVAVMYLGRFVEVGRSDEVLENPRHPYTKALMSAGLSPDPSERTEYFPLAGEIPDPSRMPSGCVLSGRCPLEVDDCRKAPVPLHLVEEHRGVACIVDPGYERSEVTSGLVD